MYCVEQFPVAEPPAKRSGFVQFVKISERRSRNALFCQIQFGRTFQRAKINHVRVALNLHDDEG